MTKSIGTEMTVRQFVERIRQRISQRHKFSSRVVKKNRRDEMLHYEAHEEFIIEEESLALNGDLLLANLKMTKGTKTKDFFKKKRGQLKFRRFFFYFQDDVIMWKKNYQEKEVLGRIFLSGMSDLQMWEDKSKKNIYLYWKIGLD
jgi:hypothetical protein